MLIELRRAQTNSVIAAPDTALGVDLTSRSGLKAECSRVGKPFVTPASRSGEHPANAPGTSQPLERVIAIASHCAGNTISWRVLRSESGAKPG